LRTWRVLLDPKATRDLEKLSHRERDRIHRFFRERLATQEDPRRFGHALKGPLTGFWTFRTGDLRIIAEIQDQRVCIFIVRIGNRREIYR
jgi:mRNA interferase RelE/StbE